MAKRRVAAKADWTILVFLNAKNNLEPFSFPNFEQMAGVGSTSRVNVLVEFGRPHTHSSTLYGAWSKTLRFRVTKGITPTENAALQDLGQVNMGAGESLVDFVTWGRSTYPARRYMLIIWDHGQGWRLRTATTFRGTDLDRKRYVAFRQALKVAAGAKPRASLPDDMRVHGGPRYVSMDDDTGDKLYHRDIQDALATITQAQPIDVIAFDACLMAMLETGYALRDVATVLVGSKDLEPGAGWNYERWLGPLVQHPAAYDAAGLGKLVVSGYRTEYGNNDDTTMSAVSLTKVTSLATAVSAFATDAKKQLAKQLTVLKNARKACANYAPGYGLNSIDLGRFVDQVKADPKVDATLRTRATAVRKALDAAVIESYASTSRQGRFGSHGVAIYFPSSDFAFRSDPDREGYMIGNTNHPVEFVQREAWAPFLHAYFAKVPQ